MIIGNPPYSIGQKSANDNAQNQSYPKLDQRIASTYVAGSTAGLSKGIYDSYIRAFRWATDRLSSKEGSIIAFISNGTWVDGNSHDGFRASLQKEFDKIYVFNLRGNQRTSGELSRREGGKIFGSGSRIPIVITILVRYPEDKRLNACQIHYHDIGDYLSREEKLRIICQAGSYKDLEWTTITPNEKNDWINQRDGLFDTLLSLAPKKKFDTNAQSVFSTYAIGVATNRDAWVSGYSKELVIENMGSMIAFYNEQIGKEKSNDETKISWTVNLNKDWEKGTKHIFDTTAFVETSYRPFCKQQLYYHRPFIERPGIFSSLCPQGKANLIITISGLGGTKDFCTLITDIIPDLNNLHSGTQCFPLYWYEENNAAQTQDLFGKESAEHWIRRDGITDWFLKEVRNRFNGTKKLTKEDIFYYVYGLLHSPDYRERFADDLRKSRPRIPIIERVEDLMAFSKAGRALADLHLYYEDYSCEAGVEVKEREHGAIDDYTYYSVEKMRFPSKGMRGRIIYNAYITVEGIPEAAYKYVINGKSAIEWVMERYAVTTDKKSGIKNDPNLWSREHGKPRYILDLLLSIIYVSLETQKIVDTLPMLNFQSL